MANRVLAPSKSRYSAASIPLQSRHRDEGKDDEAASETNDNPAVDFDPAEPGNRDREDDYPTDRPAASLINRLYTSVMSKNPLLERSAQSSGSHGAVPSTQSPLHSDESESSEDEEENGPSRPKAKGRTRTRSSAEGQGTSTHFASASSRKPRKRNTTSSTTSDLGMGIESKASFAAGGTLPRTLLSDVGGRSEATSPDSSPDRSPKSSRRLGTEQDPLDNSPYPEVRASVSATDNIALSISTPRMWILAILFALTGSSMNLFFSLRYPSVTITPVIALVLVHPLGKLWDILLKRSDDPEETFVNGIRQKTEKVEGSTSRKFRLWLAQGKWNEKEHACVYISSNVSFGFAFATDVIVEQHKFYMQDVPILYQVMLTISTQILGYSFAGLTRRYLVRPAAMIWPGTLMSTAMFSTMHAQENAPANGWKISRYRFFCYVWIGAFAWYFVPGLLFPALSYFSVVTWFAPKNVVVANLFGVASGLGLFPMTFDWAQVAYIGSPLLTPWWAAANVVGGLVIVMWIIAPILYYRNALYSAFLPILSSAVFDNTGKPYDVSRILTPDYLFDKEAYDAYSHVYLPITYVLSYALQFAALTALVTHTACWHGRDIWRQTKRAFAERQEDRKAEANGYQSIPNPSNPTEPPISRHSTNPSQTSIDDMTSSGEDVHCRLMRRYPDAPMTWYLLTFVLMLIMGIFVVEYFPVYLPWYGVLLALGITAIFFIPTGIVMAIANQHSSLYLICQLIAGELFPGRPVANMVFVTYSYISSAQGIKFSSDLKLGHYMKIPPRLLFTVQMVATLVSSLTQIGVLNWMFSHIPGLCTSDAINGFICPFARVHFNGSVLWGVVGPRRFFGPNGLYRHLVWAFLLGAFAPPAVYLIARRRIKLHKNRSTLWRKINFPILFGSLSWIPPATGLNFSVWAVVCFVFNSVIRRRRGAWWGKYTMTLSAALDSGLAFAVLVVFFGVLYPGWMEGFKWWGTEVYKQGCDWNACPYKTLGEGEKFGD